MINFLSKKNSRPWHFLGLCTYVISFYVQVQIDTFVYFIVKCIVGIFSGDPTFCIIFIRRKLECLAGIRCLIIISSFIWLWFYFSGLFGRIWSRGGLRYDTMWNQIHGWEDHILNLIWVVSMWHFFSCPLFKWTWMGTRMLEYSITQTWAPWTGPTPLFVSVEVFSSSLSFFYLICTQNCYVPSYARRYILRILKV